MLQRLLAAFVPATFRRRAAWNPLLSWDKMSTPTAPTIDNVNPSVPHKHPLATDSSEPNPTQKKSKHVTNKDRRDHFKKKQSWRSRNEEDAMRAKKGTDNEGADNEESMEDKEDDDKKEKEARMPKKKVAVLIGFCGTGYQGMQINPNAITIEGELFKAFVRAGVVSKDNSDDPRKVSLMRAARTDKGVHAAGNLLSMKMLIDKPEVVKRINEELPDQIRVWGFVRVIRSFHAKTMCDSRVYEYLLPTYVFDPPSVPAPLLAPSEPLPRSSPEEMLERRRYRISTATLDTVRKAFKAYEGTSNYHNYTIGKGPHEKTCNRYITSFDVSEPKMIQETEWLSLKVHGQAFMMHQIRKMVGLAVIIVRSGTPLSLIPHTFKFEKINIPKAPGVGLLLEQPMFGSYNERIKKDGRDRVDFNMYRTEIEAFKEKWIYQKIFEEEFRDNTFDEWIRTMDAHTGTNFGYLNPEGVIPDSAIVRPGTGRYKGGAKGSDVEDEEDEGEDG